MRIGRCEAEQDLYAILELSPGASAAEIRRAHRRLAMRYHPDRGTTGAMGAEAEQRMKAVNFAASVLLHPTARARYDALRGQAPRAPRTRSWRPAARPATATTSGGPVVAPAALRRPGRHVPAVAAFFSVALSLTLLVGCVADAFAGPAPVASSRYRIPKGPTMETPWAR